MRVEKSVANSVKTVRLGILIGMFGLVFGIGWAFWLVVGHERIHQSLEVISERAGRSAHVSVMHESSEDEKTAPPAKTHIHGDGAAHEHAPSPVAASPREEKGHEAMEGRAHDSPIMELAHTRLVRGHLHAMGLGLATVLISLVLAFTSASARVKTIASVLTGLGGIIYPFAWIVMGYMTPALGPDAAEASAVFIAGPGVGLVLLGVFTSIGYTLRDVFKRT